MPHLPQSTAVQANELLDRLAHEVRRTLKAANADQVRDLRVALRRFRQALDVVEDRTAIAGIDDIHRALKKMRARAGEVRDCDVIAKLLGKMAPPARLLTKLAHRRSRAQRRLLSALHRWISRKTDAAWRARLMGVTGKSPAQHVLLEAVKLLFKRAEKMGESIQALHRLRIAAKKLRYTMEVAGHVDAERLDQIKALQSQLGHINDFESALRIAVDESAGKKITARLKKGQRKEIRVFRKQWNKEFDRKKSQWINAVTHAPSGHSSSGPSQRTGGLKSAAG